MDGNTQSHPWTLLLRHVASHTLRASMSEFDWFMPIAVKIPELQAIESYSSQRKQRHFLEGVSEKAAAPGRKWAALDKGQLK